MPANANLNPAQLICDLLATRVDDHNADAINKIVDKQAQLNKHIDKVLDILNKCQKKLAEGVDLTTFDLEDLEDSIEDLRAIYKEQGRELPEFAKEELETPHFNDEIASIKGDQKTGKDGAGIQKRINIVSKTELEEFVAGLESTKRELVNAAPGLVTDLELLVQRYLMILQSLRKVVEDQATLNRHITSKG